jgi:hypothetical protein
MISADRNNTDKKLANLVCRFLDDITSVVPEETDLLLLQALIKSVSQVSPGLIMQNFMEFVYPLREKIQNKDESFFLNNENIFGDIEKSKVNHFKHIWQSNKLTPEDREMIWKWFSVFILVCEKEKKKM